MQDKLDAQGAQDNSEILDDGYENIQRPTTNFSTWLDDENIPEHNSKGDDNKFRNVELQSKDELLARTKTLVPEQMIVLQKVQDFAKKQFNAETASLPETLLIKLD